MTGTVTVTAPPAAARGLKLLSVKNRRLHPAAQVRSLHRIATRALSDADWIEGIPTRNNPHPPQGFTTAADHARARAQRAKAADAVEAMVWLNQQYALGYPVPTGIRAR